MVDTLTKGVNKTRSKEGSDTVTRSREFQAHGTISLTASFSWRTEGPFSYVKCTSASASKAGLYSYTKVSRWNVHKTEEEIRLGAAYAYLDYHLINTKVPTVYNQGTFKIKCDDTGAISDNG